MSPSETGDPAQRDQRPQSRTWPVAESSSARKKRFASAWTTLGALGIAPALFASLLVWIALDEPTHCGFETSCSAGAILSTGSVPLCVVWISWLVAGAVAWTIGQRAAANNSRFGSAPALWTGTLVFGIGLLLAAWSLIHGIDATHGP